MTQTHILGKITKGPIERQRGHAQQPETLADQPGRACSALCRLPLDKTRRRVGRAWRQMWLLTGWIPEVAHAALGLVYTEAQSSRLPTWLALETDGRPAGLPGP